MIVGVGKWARDVLADGEVDGPSRTRLAAYRLWTSALRRLGKPFADGENVFDREWDLLLVLDACRADAMETVADEYAFVADVDEFPSPGSNTPGWLKATFADDHAGAIADTAYVTANPHSEDLDADAFAVLDEVWRYAWDDDAGTVPPEAVTDRVVDLLRTRDPDRAVAHYMQPHLPFRAEIYPDEATVTVEESLGHSDDGERNVYHRMRDGEVSEDAVWRAYVDNLRWVLDSVETLLANVDADRVVVTADHGELFGEWGCYCHPGGVPVPALRRVPWVETTAEDERTYEPTLDPPEWVAERTSDGVEKRLRDLGYV